MNKILLILLISSMLVACVQNQISDPGHENNSDATMSGAPESIKLLSEAFQSQGVEINSFELWKCGSITGDGHTLLELVRTDLTYKEMFEQGHVIREVPNDEDVQRQLDDFKVGFVLFDGVLDHEIVIYRRNGINHRWDWDDWRYAFVIEPDGRGLYYDFEFAKEDGIAKARDVFKCERDYSNLY